jgi:hypothetical protein
VPETVVAAHVTKTAVVDQVKKRAVENHVSRSATAVHVTKSAVQTTGMLDSVIKPVIAQSAVVAAVRQLSA